MSCPLELGVKQYVAVVQNGTGLRFMVFTTGDPKFYLFCPLDKDGNQGGIQIPVKRADLRDDIRRALAHGWGNAHL